MEKVTLGGERLGSGKKMKVGLHGYDRSTHDLSAIWRSTMSAGTLVPFYNEVALPGDTFDIELDVDVMTHPTIGPMLGSYKVQLDIFQIPVRLYVYQLHTNLLEIGLKMGTVNMPQVEIQANANIPPTDVSQIHPSAIFSYLGIRGLGRPTIPGTGVITRRFNAIPWLGYWDIFKNYYSNKQEEKAFVIHSPRPVPTEIDRVEVTDTEQTTAPAVYEIPLYPDNIVIPQTFKYESKFGIIYDPNPIPPPARSIVMWTNMGFLIPEDVFYNKIDDGIAITYQFTKPEFLGLVLYSYAFAGGDITPNEAPQLQEFDLAAIDVGIKVAQSYPDFVIKDSPTYHPWSYALEINSENDTSITQNQEGLAVKTYQSDLLNNWMRTAWIDGFGGISEVTAISTAGDSFTIDSFLLAEKVYNMLNRIAISGGTYDDWLETVYDHNVYRRATTPIYHGSLIRELAFQEIVSNSAAESDGVQQPLGQLAGKGVMTQKKKGGNITIKIDEPSFIMGIISLTPRIDYSQGNWWGVNLKTMNDFHKPALDEIGYQDLITEQMAYWDTTVVPGTTPGAVEYMSAGKQPAWVNYMTNVNQTLGNFAIPTNEMFMTLNRRFEQDEDTGAIKDLTTYIDPSKFNFIFAQTSIDAQNFWVQINKKVTARRKMSAKIMPNL